MARFRRLGGKFQVEGRSEQAGGLFSLSLGLGGRMRMKED